MSTNIHNQTISSSGTVLTVTRPVSSQSGSNQQPQILSVVSNPSNQANFSQVVLTPSRPASNTVTVTPASVSALSHQRGSQPRVINLNQPLRLGGQILTRPTMTLNQNFPVARNTFIIRDGTLQFLNMNHNLTQSNQPQTLRLQTMVPHSTNVGTTIRAPQMTAIPNSSVITSRSGQVQLSQPLTIQTTPANAQAASSQPSQMSPNTAKIKCKNFLSTLIRLASDQPEQTANNVKNLIQSLIDGVIEPDEFTNQLQSELNSSPQPCLIPFLKKSLPYLRYSLMVHEKAIDGVRSPPPGSVQLPLQPQSLSQNTFQSLRAPYMTAIPNSRVITSIDDQVRLKMPLTSQKTPANTGAASSQPSQMSPNTAKIKCKYFLSTLIRLSKVQSKKMAIYVKHLIQSLIDGVIEPDEFINELQSELNSSPQPCLLPFLKKSLPYLRYSLMVHETAIDGVRPPPPGSVQLPSQSTLN